MAGFWQPLQRQASLQRTVPLERWDHVPLYDPEELPGKSYVNFAAFAQVMAMIQVAGYTQLLPASSEHSRRASILACVLCEPEAATPWNLWCDWEGLTRHLSVVLCVRAWTCMMRSTSGCHPLRP